MYQCTDVSMYGTATVYILHMLSYLQTVVSVIIIKYR
jgi:hypothetical protein